MPKSVFEPPLDSPRERIREIRESVSYLIRNLIHEAPMYNKKCVVDPGTLHYICARILELEDRIEHLEYRECLQDRV